ncbi:MAG: hypothetical protein E7360_06270, partial [Clostridiales bacterium]|nr:hypothetical protein [Clostridiales bacterium]
QQDTSLGRFLFAAYDSMDDLFAGGNGAYNSKNDEKILAWGALQKGHANENKLKVNGTYTSKEVNYNGANAVLTIKVGETETEVFFGGEKFATLNLKQSDFADGKMYLSLIAYDANLEAKVKITAETPVVTPDEPEEPKTNFYNQDGTALEWVYDDNGVSTQTAYKADGSAYTGYGMYNPAGCYTLAGDGSTFLLEWSHFIAFAPQDVTKDIVISFTMDPSNNWSGGDDPAKLGRFFFAAYDNLDDLFAGGINAWQGANNEKIVAEGALKENDYTNKIGINGQVSKEINYNGANAVLTIRVGETETEVFFGGEKFATLSLKQSDFADGKMYLSLISIGYNLEAKVKVSSQPPTVEPDEPEQPTTKFYDANGNELVWEFDKNGVNTQKVYKDANGTAYGMYGMITSDGCYGERDDGSVFVLSNGAYIAFKPQDVTKDIVISFTMDPNNSWSQQDASLGRFLFAAYDSMDDLFAGANSAWKGANDEKILAWGALSEGANKHKLAIGEQKSKEINYNGANAVLIIKVGETETEVFFGGEKFATLALTQSDFADGNMYLSLIAYDANLEAKVKVSDTDPTVEPDEPAEPKIYYNKDGSELVWAFDKNGVSTQVPYDKDGNPIGYYGMYAPDSCYGERDDGSVFVLPAAKYMLIGGELDITKAITITFTMDPSGSWGEGGALGRFIFSLFDNVDLAISAGNSGWNSSLGAKVVAFGSQMDTLNGSPVDYFHKISVNGSLSDEFNYDGAEAKLTIYIGEKLGESFVAFNGKEFAQLNVIQSDFKDSIAHLSVISLDKNNEFKVKVSQEDIRTNVKILSNVSTFEDIDIKATIGRVLNVPTLPTIEGYTFDALYVDSSYIIKYDGTNSVQGPMTLYAKYLDNSKTYHSVTLQSLIGEYDSITFNVENGATIGEIGKVFYSEGFFLKWKTEEGLFNELETAVEKDLTLTAVWVEEEIVLYHKMNDVVDENYLWEYLCDSNGWDSEYTSFDIGDTFVDADGKEIISSYYGSYQHDSSFKEYDTYSTFLLPGAGAITNLMRLDLTKEIVITYTANNWDTANDNPVVAGDITFQLFDNILSALKAGHASNENAKVAIRTSSVDMSVDFGRFIDVLNGVKQKNDDFKFEQDKQFIIKIFISEDGTENYVTVNGIAIEGAIEGVKRSDFKGGYAYLHIANSGSTHYFNCLLAQTSKLILKDAENGTYSVDKSGDILFKESVTITLTPNTGYAVKSVLINGESYIPDSNNMITFYKGWEDEEIEVVFAEAFTATFVVGEGASSIKDQVACAGETFYKPSNPKKEGYKFVGWYTDEELTVEYDFKTTVTEDITLYAKWEAKESESSKKGCGSAIASGSLLIATLALGSACLSLAKKKSK